MFSGSLEPGLICIYASISNFFLSVMSHFWKFPCLQRMSLIAQANICHLSSPYSLCFSNKYSLGWKSGNTQTSHVKQAQESYRIANGRNSMISKAGETRLYLYFMKRGRTVFSAKKAPCFIVIMQVPLVVPPSGNIKKGAYWPVYSISSCLSRIAISALALLWALPPRGM